MKFIRKIQVGSVNLEGILSLPEKAQALVLFSHGSGSGRLSPRNNFVAEVLRKAGLGTLLCDLLTEEEDATYENRFNIKLLTERLVGVAKWVMNQDSTKNLRIGFFGASTGAASAMDATVKLNHPHIGAIVSRGGRPDLAIKSLPKIKVPTLFIVGGNDFDVIRLNEEAYNKLVTEKKKLAIVAHATHLFEEPGTLEEVARLATEWFIKYLLTSYIV